jgi:hypothetical protein
VILRLQIWTTPSSVAVGDKDVVGSRQSRKQICYQKNHVGYTTPDGWCSGKRAFPIPIGGLTMQTSDSLRPNYEHHIFVSYRRSDKDWVRWTRHNFFRVLGSLLRPSLGKVSIYIDESIETGAIWPTHLALNLARSRVMVAVLSRDYFLSRWCRSEFALMYHRERSTQFRTPANPYGFIIPVIIDDGDSFPKEVQAMRGEPLHKFANPFIQSGSPKQEELSEVLRERICPVIERVLTRVPSFDLAWEQLAYEQFENMFQILMQTQKTVPSLRLPKLP